MVANLYSRGDSEFTFEGYTPVSTFTTRANGTNSIVGHRFRNNTNQLTASVRVNYQSGFFDLRDEANGINWFSANLSTGDLLLASANVVITAEGDVSGSSFDMNAAEFEQNPAIVTIPASGSLNNIGLSAGGISDPAYAIVSNGGVDSVRFEETGKFFVTFNGTTEINTPGSTTATAQIIPLINGSGITRGTVYAALNTDIDIDGFSGGFLVNVTSAQNTFLRFAVTSGSASPPSAGIERLFVQIMKVGP